MDQERTRNSVLSLLNQLRESVAPATKAMIDAATGREIARLPVSVQLSMLRAHRSALRQLLDGCREAIASIKRTDFALAAIETRLTDRSNEGSRTRSGADGPVGSRTQAGTSR